MKYYISCKRCGKPLTKPESILRGYGMSCYKKLLTNLPEIEIDHEAILRDFYITVLKRGLFMDLEITCIKLLKVIKLSDCETCEHLGYVTKRSCQDLNIKIKEIKKDGNNN